MYLLRSVHFLDLDCTPQRQLQADSVARKGQVLQQGLLLYPAPGERGRGRAGQDPPRGPRRERPAQLQLWHPARRRTVVHPSSDHRAPRPRGSSSQRETKRLFTA